MKKYLISIMCLAFLNSCNQKAEIEKTNNAIESNMNRHSEVEKSLKKLEELSKENSDRNDENINVDSLGWYLDDSVSK